MRRLLVLLPLLLATWLQAQVISLSPEKPGFTETVTLTFRATEGNAALAGHEGEVYAHTGLINDQSTHANDWKNVVADWADNQERLRLRRTAPDTYELQFSISELYGVPPAGNVTALAFVFRNADGSVVAKDKGGSDIFYFFKTPTFQPPPTTLSRSLAPQPEWARHASIYEVNIRQYTPEGTINAFAQHLPRLRELGVDILWLMPVQPIGVLKRKGPLGSYYSISDYTAINPEFGTAEDFKRLVDQAHGLGFKVVLDWVANHSAWDHAWAGQHPDWYSRDEQGQIVSPYDWTDVADLNYDHYYMRRAMTDAMLYWVKEMDIDGFRCDVAGEVPVDFWEDLREKLNAVKPVWMLAENADQTWLMNRAFNANYGWPFHHLMNEAAKGHASAAELLAHFEAIKANYPAGAYPMQFITNHDENSWAGTVFERLGEGHKAFAVLYFTVPGMPLIYSGQEAGLNKRLKFFDKDPIDWSGLPSLQPFYASLNMLKAQNPALWNGEAGGWIQPLDHDAPDKVLAYVREKDGNKVLVLINLSAQPQSFALQAAGHEGLYHEVFQKQDLSIGKRQRLSLPAWGYQVLVYQGPAKFERQFERIEQGDTGLKIHVSDGTIVLSTYSEQAIGVEFVPLGAAPSLPSYAVAAAPRAVKAQLRDLGNIVQYRTAGLEVSIQKTPFRISYAYQERPLLAETEGYVDMAEGFAFRFGLSPGEWLSGGGSRVLGMNRRGQRLKLYNQPSYGYETKADLMYYSMPVLLSSQHYMLVFDNGATGHLDIGHSEADVLQLEAVGGRRGYLLVAADAWPALTQAFTGLTGRQPMPPRWALGNIASRMGYHSQQEVEEVVEKYQSDQIPLDGIVLDLYWFGPTLKGTMGNLEWYLDSFPRPVEMMAGLKAKGVNTILITEPFILKNSGKYPEVAAQNLLGTDAEGKPYIFDFYFGTTGLLDIFKPEARQWFWNVYKKHTASGVAGWWGDLGEPEVHPDDIRHAIGLGRDVHNLYGHVWAQTLFEGFAKDFPERRPLILMRAGYVGSQRYGMVPWSGDVNRTWGGLKPQVEISLTMGLQGMAYMHSDLGGFAGDYEDAELYVRWLQYGVFQPIYRTHAQEGVPAEPIFWDEATKALARRAIEWRYRLMPYLYTLGYENTTTGLPLMRPLFYVDGNPDLLDNTRDYLWGNDFLVSPVTDKGAREQSVYLPGTGYWFDFWKGSAHQGGQTLRVPLTMEQIPVFVRAGAFIPTVPVVQSLSAYSSEQLTLHYYHHASVRESSGQMYEDDGETKDAHLKQAYELLRFQSAFGKKGLRISIRPEGYAYKGKPAQRRLETIVHAWDGAPRRVTANGKALSALPDAAALAQAESGYFWDAAQRQLHIKQALGSAALELAIE